MELIGHSASVHIDPGCVIGACGYWLAIGVVCVCVIALASTTNLRGNEQVHSPFSTSSQLKGMKNPWALIRWVYRWLMSWYLKLVTCCVSRSLPVSASHPLSLFFFLSLAALQDRAPAGLLGCQYCTVSAKCQPGTHTHKQGVRTAYPQCLFPSTVRSHSRWTTLIWLR